LINKIRKEEIVLI